MFAAQVVVDGKDHMLGRLASIIAKELLSGQRVVVVRCEEIVISGSIMRNKVKYHQFLKKRMNTNPTHGPFHYRSPAKIFWRTVRGMLPHKTHRGTLALKRLRAFEGIPSPYNKQKRLVVPAALKVLRLKPGRNFTKLGRLATEVGWKHLDLVKKLEAKRKEFSKERYMKKKLTIRQKIAAEANADLSKITPTLKALGYN